MISFFVAISHQQFQSGSWSCSGRRVWTSRVLSTPKLHILWLGIRKLVEGFFHRSSDGHSWMFKSAQKGCNISSNGHWICLDDNMLLPPFVVKSRLNPPCFECDVLIGKMFTCQRWNLGNIDLVLKRICKIVQLCWNSHLLCKELTIRLKVRQRSSSDWGHSTHIHIYNIYICMCVRVYTIQYVFLYSTLQDAAPHHHLPVLRRAASDVASCSIHTQPAHLITLWRSAVNFTVSPTFLLHRNWGHRSLIYEAIVCNVMKSPSDQDRCLWNNNEL